MSKQQARQNLRYEIQKAEKVRKSLEGDEWSMRLPSLPYLHFFYILTKDTVAGSNIGFVARKDILAQEVLF